MGEGGGWFTSNCDEEPDEHNTWNSEEQGDVPGYDDDEEGDDES